MTECALASSRNTYESWASSGTGQVQMSLYVSEGLELAVIFTVSSGRGSDLLGYVCTSSLTRTI